MHQTTVRFGADLWAALEHECARLGVSAAQYLREAALARLVYAAGRRGDDEFELALDLVTGAEPTEGAPAGIDELETLAAPSALATSARERAERETSESAALWAQSQLARERARRLRELTRERRQTR